MIELKDIVVKFGDFEALHNINVNVKEGEFFTFLGPSGCGKSRAAAGCVFAGSVFRPFASDGPGAGLPYYRRDGQPPVRSGSGGRGPLLAGIV